MAKKFIIALFGIPAGSALLKRGAEASGPSLNILFFDPLTCRHG
jgi:hypothetical protein